MYLTFIGFSEHPLSMSVDRGEQVTLNCTYRTSQQGLPTINWTAPSEISVTPTTTQLDAATLQSTISFTAATSSYAGDYQCIATVGSDSFNSDTATLTVNCKSIDKMQIELFNAFQTTVTVTIILLCE